MTKRPYIQGITVCEGDCGRFLRPSHLPREAHPDTVQRFSGGKCKYCYRRTQPEPVRGEDQLIQECKSCGHPTRPGRVKAAAFPGTRLRIGQLCRRCDSAGETVPADRIKYIAAEVRAFEQWRRNRGVPTEGRKIA